jgi:hypothetical protein
MAHKEWEVLEEKYELCTAHINEMEQATGHNPLIINIGGDNDKMNIYFQGASSICSNPYQHTSGL